MTLVDSPASATPAAQTRRAYRIVLIDGQRIFRQALRVLFATEDEFAVVGEAGHAAEALELIGSLQPDVVVTELHLTDGSAVPLIEQIHARFPKLAILVLTAGRAHDVAAAVRKAGALGYLLKDGGRSELLSALREVVAGRWYRSIAPEASLMRGHTDQASLSTRAAYLTERQRQVLRSVARGYRTREIAQMLGVSVKAVHKQRERLRIALQLNSTAALTRFAVHEGFAEDRPATR
jgi:DNA-binding NarL/FixJ family response regulator